MHIAGRPQTAPLTIREASQEVISYKTGENIRSLTFGPCFFYISEWADSIKSLLLNNKYQNVSCQSLPLRKTRQKGKEKNGGKNEEQTKAIPPLRQASVYPMKEGWK